MHQHSKSEREEIMREFASSNLSLPEFARQRGVKYGTIKHWRHQRAKQNQAPTKFVEVKNRQTETTTYSIQIGRHLKLELSKIPSAEYLAELSWALERCSISHRR